MPYFPREKNIIQSILKDNYSAFEDCYDEKYAEEYGIYRLDRISKSVCKFRDCGDWEQGVARIKCSNKDCKQWYLCPSCHQKRVLLLSEHLSQEVMLRLPHRQFVFTVPKLLRPYFKNNRKLFASVSKLIHKLITAYYTEASGKEVTTGTIVAHQTYGDILRFNPHWHCLILEGGIDENNDFYHVRIKDITKLAEAFRRAVINFFVKEKLLNSDFATQLLNWKNSGFSLDNSVFLFPRDDKARESLCQYIARHPVSLQKISYDPIKKKVLYHTKYNDYFKENVKLFTAIDFIADLTVHIPPKGKHLIRYYGLYASRTKGKAKKDGRFEKFGIKKEPVIDDNLPEVPDYQETSNKASRRAWARLINKIYEVDPLICPYCGAEMKVIAIIQDSKEIKKIIKHLAKKKRAPPVIDKAAS